MTKPKGSRGSWFALWRGEHLACIHKFWWKSGGIYHEVYPKNFSERIREKQNDLIETIRRTGKAILTDDDVTLNEGRPVAFRRKDYIGVFAVKIIRENQDELVLQFEGRLD